MLGYIEHCEKCGQPAMLSEQTSGWVCPACGGPAPLPADELVYDRAALVIRQLLASAPPGAQAIRGDGYVGFRYQPGAGSQQTGSTEQE